MQPHPLTNFFGQNLGEIGQIWLELGKIKTCTPKNIRSPTAMPR